MDYECRATGSGDDIDKALQICLVVLIVDTDAALDRDDDRLAGPHSRNTICNELRLSHQAGAKAAFLNPIRRTADIEIDFIVAEVGADLGGLGEFSRIGTAELQRNRMLVLREANEMLPIATNDGIRRNHLGIKQGAFRQLTVERPAMPIRPIHHRGDTETMT